MNTLNYLNQLFIKYKANLLFSLLLIVLPFYGFLNIKLLLISLFSVTVFFYHLFNSENPTSYTHPTFIVCLAFLVLSFASCLWSINISEAIHSSMNWLLVFLFSYSVSLLRLSTIQINQIKRLIQFLCLILLIQNIIALVLSDNAGVGWNNILGFNHNYTSSLLVLLTPFIICDKRINRLLRLLVIATVLVVLIVIGSRGSILGFLVFLISYLASFYNKFASVVSFSVILFIGVIISMKYFSFEGGLSRLELIKSSISLWKEHPFIGSGAGSWNIEIFKYGLDYDDSLNLKVKTAKTVLSHNMPFKVLAELGLFGVLLFSTFITYPLVRFFRSKEKSSFLTAVYFSSLLFIFFSNIYTFCTLTKFDFSGHLICFFLFFGVIFQDHKE